MNEEQEIKKLLAEARDRQKELLKMLDGYNRRINAQKKLIHALDPKWNVPQVIEEQKRVLEKLKAERGQVQDVLHDNRVQINNLGVLLFEQNMAKHEATKRSKEIDRFNRAFTARIHAHEFREALDKVEAYNKALLGEEESNG